MQRKQPLLTVLSNSYAFMPTAVMQEPVDEEASTGSLEDDIAPVPMIDVVERPAYFTSIRTMADYEMPGLDMTSAARRRLCIGAYQTSQQHSPKGAVRAYRADRAC